MQMAVLVAGHDTQDFPWPMCKGLSLALTIWQTSSPALKPVPRTSKQRKALPFQIRKVDFQLDWIVNHDASKIRARKLAAPAPLAKECQTSLTQDFKTLTLSLCFLKVDSYIPGHQTRVIIVCWDLGGKEKWVTWRDRTGNRRIKKRPRNSSGTYLGCSVEGRKFCSSPFNSDLRQWVRERSLWNWQIWVQIPNSLSY